MADFSNYNNGKKGGKIRLRSTIEILDKITLLITNTPYGLTTQALIDSILKANSLGKIKIKKIEDKTAENVNIVIHLPKGISPDVTIEALYGFTNCEISISPNCCVIKNGKPEINKSNISKLQNDSIIQYNTAKDTWIQMNKGLTLDSFLGNTLEVLKRLHRNIAEEKLFNNIENNK